MRTSARWVRAEILVCFITSSHQTATKTQEKKNIILRATILKCVWPPIGFIQQLNRWKMRHYGHWPKTNIFISAVVSTLFMADGFLFILSSQSLFSFSLGFLRRYKEIERKKYNWIEITIENFDRLLTRWTFIIETLSIDFIPLQPHYT